MKIRPVRTELFYADGRTGGQTGRHMTKLIVTFPNFTNAPKINDLCNYLGNIYIC